MNDRHNEDDGDIPTFTCRLHMPEGLAPGVRTLIEQQDISRQLVEHLYRKSTKAYAMAIASDSRIAEQEKRLIALEQFKWKATWIVGGVLVCLEVFLRHFAK